MRFLTLWTSPLRQDGGVDRHYFPVHFLKSSHLELRIKKYESRRFFFILNSQFLILVVRVDRGRLELPTFSLSRNCLRVRTSSYNFVDPVIFAHPIPRWTRADSNRLPLQCECSVLPGELRAREKGLWELYYELRKKRNFLPIILNT